MLSGRGSDCISMPSIRRWRRARNMAPLDISSAELWHRPGITFLTGGRIHRRNRALRLLLQRLPHCARQAWAFLFRSAVSPVAMQGACSQCLYRRLRWWRRDHFHRHGRGTPRRLRRLSIHVFETASSRSFPSTCLIEAGPPTVVARHITLVHMARPVSRALCRRRRSQSGGHLRPGRP